MKNLFLQTKGKIERTKATKQSSIIPEESKYNNDSDSDEQEATNFELQTTRGMNIVHNLFP